MTPSSARKRAPGLHATPSARWLPALTCLICALALTSCARGTRPTPVEPLPAELLALLAPLVRLDPTLTRPCPAALPQAEDDRAATLIRNHQDSAAIYHACKDRQGALAEAVRERERLEAERIDRARRALTGERPDG